MSWAAKIALVSGSKKWNCSMVGAKSSLLSWRQEGGALKLFDSTIHRLKLFRKRYLIIDY